MITTDKKTMDRKDDRAGVVLAVTDFLRANGKRRYRPARKKQNETKNLFTGR